MKNIIIIGLMALLAISCSQSNNQQVEESNNVSNENIVELTAAQVKNAGIELGELQTKPIASMFKATGKVDVPPQNAISISVPFGGYLKSTKLMPGMPVKKGQVLATIENAEYVQIQQDYLTAKAQLAYTESEFKRQKELNDSKASSDKQFELTKANYQTQQVLVKSLEEKLRLIGYIPSAINANSISRSVSIVSPIDGYVSGINAHIGKFIDPSEVLIELVNPNEIHLELTVFEKDIQKLQVGQKIYAFTNADDSKRYTCTIDFISRSVSQANASTVIARFASVDKSLLPGTFMNAEVEVSGADALSIPTESIVRFENKHYVFVQTKLNTFEMMVVELGNVENGFTEIINSALLTDKKIAVKGAYNLLMAIKNKAEE